jgi:RNA polymerase sigma factor (sigma-70 family)
LLKETSTGNAKELLSLENDDWPKRLQEGAQNRDFAIEELRCYLLRGLARSLTHRYGGKIQVEDVAQVALVKILASLETFQGRSRFTTWAMSIATRIGISELRRHYYKDVSLDQSIEGESHRYEIEDTSANSAEQHAGKQAIFQLLTQLIQDCLSEKQRVAINGTLEGLPIEEIAVRLNSNRNAVYKLVHDARLRLRQGFEANGVRAEDIASTLL